MYHIKNYISGNIQCDSDKRISIFNPSTGEIQGEVVLSNKNDFNNTVNSSKKALHEWSNVTPLNRSRILSSKLDPSSSRPKTSLESISTSLKAKLA